MPHIVAVEHISVHAALKQFAFECLRDGRLARARQAGEPNHCAPMSHLRCSFSARDLLFRPKNIFALGDRAIGISSSKNNSASADASLIGDDKTTEIYNA